MKEWIKPVAYVVIGLIIFTLAEKQIKKALTATGMWEEE